MLHEHLNAAQQRSGDADIKNDQRYKSGIVANRQA